MDLEVVCIDTDQHPDPEPATHIEMIYARSINDPEYMVPWCKVCIDHYDADLGREKFFSIENEEGQIQYMEHLLSGLPTWKRINGDEILSNGMKV